ncbi:DUF4383 domain-containing protein [Pseudonocardia pini]|uniref:DUF4383 domain-containing protein n=1 Tax=Pseudonocardia pini TaxID=2758030 RepID=UPI0015F0C1CE|nr:DUF4383 domain-containing protein [Pseudonocardia pini]
MVDRQGAMVLGLSSNGLLAWVSVLAGAMLAWSGLRRGRLASTVSVASGALFLVAGLASLAVLGSAMNVFAFRGVNVVFSVVVGTILVLTGSYGRFTGNVPDQSPYSHDVPEGEPGLTVAERDDRLHHRAAIEELAEAERAEARHHATPEQRRRLAAAAGERSHDDRRRAWEGSAPTESGTPRGPQ